MRARPSDGFPGRLLRYSRFWGFGNEVRAIEFEIYARVVCRESRNH